MENKFRIVLNAELKYLKIKDEITWHEHFDIINGDGFEEDNTIKITIIIHFVDVLDFNLHKIGNFGK